MTVNLGKYPRHRQPSPIGKNIGKIPTRASVQEQPRAVDPGVAGGPTDVRPEMFGKGMGEAMQVIGAGVTEMGLDSLESERKMEAKIRNDIEKNINAKNITKASAAYKEFVTKFDWNREYENSPEGPEEEFTKGLQNLGDTFDPLANNASPGNKLDYQSKLLKIQIENNLIGSESRLTARQAASEKRVKDSQAAWYVTQTGPISAGGPSRVPDTSDPSFQHGLAEVTSAVAGELSIEKQDDLYREFLIASSLERIKFLSSPDYHARGGTLKDPRAALGIFLKRMEERGILDRNTLASVNEAVRDINKRVYDNSAEGREAEREREDRKTMGTELTALYELYTHPDNKDQKKMSLNNYLRRRQDIFTVYGKAIAPMEKGETFTEGQTYLSPEGDISKTEGAPTTVPEGSILVPGDEATGKFRDPSAESPDTGTIPPSVSEVPASTDSDFPPGTIINPKTLSPPKLTSRDKNKELGYPEFNDPVTGEPHPVAKWITVADAEESTGVEFKPTEESVRAFSLAAMGIRGSAKDAMAIMKKDQLTFFRLITKNIAEELGKGTYNSTAEAYYAEYNKIQATNPELIPTAYDFEDAFDDLMKEEKIFSAAAPGPNDVKNMMLELDASAKKINLDDATGVFSGLTKGFGNLFGSFFESAVSPEVVVGRLQLGLVVRDFIRLFMLSKRFAVKEQEFLRGIYPGPGALNSPAAARALMIDLDRELDTALNAYKKELKMDVISVDAKQEIWQDVTRIVNMKKRISRFDLKGFGLFDRPESPEAIQRMARDNPDVFKAMFKEDPILEDSLNVLDETKLLPSGMEKPPAETSLSGEDLNANLRDTIQNINPDDIVSFANSFIKDNPEDPAGAFLEIINRIGESKTGDFILDEIRSIIQPPSDIHKKTPVKKKAVRKKKRKN